MPPDILGHPFQTRELPLGGEPDHPASATLVRHPATAAEGATRGAVLHVHGFVDYFFQVELARHFAARGFDFYAVDLRAHGRSLRQGEMPNYVTDLSLYFEELDTAARVIREEDGHRGLVLLGHSTGGLVASLWAHERRHDDVLDALVLNSPWLDLAEPWLTRTVGTALVDVVGGLWPTWVLPKGLSPVYGQSIHVDHHGEWDFRTEWKPIEGFPVRAGWLRAIRRGQARLHRGLDVRVPVLVLHSARSIVGSARRRREKRWQDDVLRADTVLDVAQIARWAPRIGRRVTTTPIEGGMHDLFLSAEPVRRHALSEVDTWLDSVR
ncbi:alpha/beta hydrolase [Streptoalloteichus hindustanus]|uniref:Lysophospholipase, alpha-beta hydrolase superfamily n=1 Tax=Streptoalloteichus hindustanus TaxID=2017 RepID=A0A1M5H2L2_STRHI|nr:alpha/beta hydrolase [Streptoalloteichus hindustanus]SHG10106.1 Lysophospholipase, alpha-beta hydrolase superfamily [Streptoalloteichus hindustanus]